MLPLSDSDLKTSSRPVVNLTLISICAAVFIYELVIGASDMGQRYTNVRNVQLEINSRQRGMRHCTKQAYVQSWAIRPPAPEIKIRVTLTL